MYGQTEASPRMSILDYRLNYKKFNSIGKPLKGGEFTLVDNKNRKIKKPNHEGELIYYGKNVSLGYSKNLFDLNKGDMNKQKLFTGDMAIFDKDNYYYITGRKKRFIKLFGIRLSLDEIENMLLKEFKFVTDCEINDEKLLIKHNNKNLYEKEIIKKLSSRININQNFIKLKLVKNIKKNFLKNKAII